MIGRAFAWSGGGAFVISLSMTAWWYWHGVELSTSGPRGPAVVADLGLLTLFALHHSLLARDWAKTLVARIVPPHLIRSLYVWIASLLLIGVCVWWQPVGGTLYRLNGWSKAPFVVLQLVGLGLVLRAVRAIRALELAGIVPPHARPDELQAKGPYSLVRHPLYLGWILAVCGTAHMTGDRLVFAAATTGYILIAIPWEERGLVREFGERYERYRQQVRWRVVPFLY